MRKDNIRADTIEVEVPTLKFEEMIKVLSTQYLSESQKAKGTVFLNNKEFIITGSMGTGTGFGYALLWGNRVEDLKLYKGKLKPLEISEHHLEIDKKNRRRGYEGQVIKFEKRNIVCCEEYTFFEIKVGNQTALF